MTETTKPPTKRAPRKRAPVAADPAEVTATGVTAHKARQIREDIEAATGRDVTAAAADRIRDKATAAGEALTDTDPDLAGATIAAQPAARDEESAEASPDVDQAAKHEANLAAIADAELPDAPALPDGVIACGPGELTPGDAAQVAAFAAELEARGGLTRPDGDEAFDVAALVAPIADDQVHGFDPHLLIAGYITTAPDGTRVTVVKTASGTVTATMPLDLATDLVHGALTGVHLPGEDPRPHPGQDPRKVRLSAEDAAATEEARALEARAGELKEAADAIRSRVKEKLGGEDGLGEIAVDDQGRELARWTRVSTTRLDGTALKTERRDVWDAFARTSMSRRFTWAD